MNSLKFLPPSSCYNGNLLSSSLIEVFSTPDSNNPIILTMLLTLNCCVRLCSKFLVVSIRNHHISQVGSFPSVGPKWEICFCSLKSEHCISSKRQELQNRFDEQVSIMMEQYYDPPRTKKQHTIFINRSRTKIDPSQ